MKVVSIILLLFGIIVARFSYACSACSFGDNKFYRVVAYNLDWEQLLPLTVFINPRNENKIATPFPMEGTKVTAKSLQWASIYGSITVSPAARSLPVTGVNEKGLSISVLQEGEGLASVVGDKARAMVNEFQFVQYLLDTCSSATEVVAKVRNLRIDPFFVSLKYFVSDTKQSERGEVPRSAVIEIENSRFLIHEKETLPITALENNSYGYSLTQLKSNLESSSRFSKIAKLLSEYQTPNDESFNSFYGKHLLGHVKQGHTLMHVVYTRSRFHVWLVGENPSDAYYVDLPSLDYLKIAVPQQFELKPGSEGDFHEKLVGLTKKDFASDPKYSVHYCKSFLDSLSAYSNQ